MPARERRYILRSIFTPGSVKFWNLKTDAARLIYLAMIVNADDDGRVECGWREVSAMAPLWQVKQNVIIGAVKDLEGVGLIRKYGVDKYGTFLGWSQRSIAPTEDPVSMASRYGLAPTSLPHRSHVATESLPCRPIVADEKTVVYKWCCIINGFTQSQSGKEVKWQSEPIPAPPEGSINLFHKQEKLPLVSKEVSKQETSFSSGECFKEARRVFRRIVGANFGALGTRDSEWAGFVAKYGKEKVLAALQLWATENKEWLKNECKYPLTNFLKNREEAIEAVDIEHERVSSESEEDTSPSVSDIRPSEDGLVPVDMNVSGRGEPKKKMVAPDVAKNYIAGGHAKPWVEQAK